MRGVGKYKPHRLVGWGVVGVVYAEEFFWVGMWWCWVLGGVGRDSFSCIASLRPSVEFNVIHVFDDIYAFLELD